MENILKSLTLEQAYNWKNQTDKWLYIDNYILSPNDLRATDKTVNAIEDQFMHLMQQAEIDGMRL